jgi:hypothetical protein
LPAGKVLIELQTLLCFYGNIPAKNQISTFGLFSATPFSDQNRSH